MSGISLGGVTAALLLGRATAYVFSLINSVILARSLGVDRLGVYAYAMGVAALFALLPNLGISTVVTRTIAREPEDAGGIVRAAIRAQVLLAGGVAILIPAFAAILPEQPVPLGYIGLAAAQLAIGTLSWPYLAVIGGHARYDRLALSELLASCAGTACTVTAALLGGGVAAFLLAHLLAAVFSVLAARGIARPFFPPLRRQVLGLRSLFRQSAPLGAIAAAQSLYTRLDVVMLGQMASPTALGLYSAAYKPINLAVHLGGTVAGPLLPLMALGPPHGAPAAFAWAMRGLGVAAPLLDLLCTGLAIPILRLLFGDTFAPAAPILIVLAWSAVANWLYAPLGISLQARGYERAWLYCSLFGLALNAAANWWAIPRWGGIGAATATLASEIGLLTLGVALVSRKLAILPPARPVLLSVSATAAAVAALVAMSGLGAIGATGGALLVYGSLVVLFRIVTIQDAARVMGWVRQAIAGGARE